MPNHEEVLKELNAQFGDKIQSYKVDNDTLIIDLESGDHAYNVLNYFKTIMTNHPSIEMVSQGLLSDFDYDEFPNYPIGNVAITQTAFGTSTTDYQIQLIVADKVKNKNNESDPTNNEITIPFYKRDDLVDIQSNTIGILKDLTSYTQRSVDGFEINSEIVCEPFADQFNNGLAGWVATFTLTTHNNKDRCLFNLYP